MNAALLVVEMLAITDAELAAKLADHRVEIAGLSGAYPERLELSPRAVG